MGLLPTRDLSLSPCTVPVTKPLPAYPTKVLGPVMLPIVHQKKYFLEIYSKQVVYEICPTAPDG